jgi:hypothetical protein
MQNTTNHLNQSLLLMSLIMASISILSIFILVSSCHTNKENGTLLPSLEKQSLYPALFKAEALNEWCLWKPTPAAKDSSNVSTDGFCHTRLDTILNYVDSGKNKAVMIFGTYVFDKNGLADCHACAPMVSIAVAHWTDNGNWQVLKFIKNFGKHGSYGQQPQYGIAHFGRNFFLLENWSYMSQGDESSWKIFWHLPSLVTSLEIGGEDDSGAKEDEKTVTNWDESIADTSENGITKVVIHKKGLVYEEGKGQYSVDSARVYILNDMNIFKQVQK